MSMIGGYDMGKELENERGFSPSEVALVNEIYRRIMQDVTQFGSNNCKAITEDRLKFIFRHEFGLIV